MEDVTTNLQYVLPPYQHQRDGINATVDRLKRYGGAALFVDMGLGKSAMAIHVSRVLRPKRILIICPKGIVPVWKDEFHKHVTIAPPILVYDALKAKNKSFQSALRRFGSLETTAIGVINVEAFQTENKAVSRFVDVFSGGICIVDESTNIKNPKAARTKALLKCAPDFRYRIIMTGTEITNTVLDLYAQFAFAVPGIWSTNYYAFRARYAVMKEIPVANGRMVKIVVGYRKIDELLHRINPYTFRAKKEDCFDLPEKIYVTLPVELNKEQQAVYNQLKTDMVAEYEGETITVTQALTLLLRFHQVTGGYFPETHAPLGSNPKITALLNDLSETSEKAIIWCVYKAEIEGVVHAIRKEYGGDAVVRYTGDESTAEREQSIASFRGGARFFVANPQVAGYGLNLQFCTLQYFYSRNRRMDMNKQAEDRSHRIGTTSACVYKDLMIRGTVDEAIYESIMEKKTLLDGIQSMDMDKISSILGGKSIS